MNSKVLFYHFCWLAAQPNSIFKRIFLNFQSPKMHKRFIIKTISRHFEKTRRADLDMLCTMRKFQGDDVL